MSTAFQGGVGGTHEELCGALAGGVMLGTTTAQAADVVIAQNGADLAAGSVDYGNRKSQAQQQQQH